MKQLFSSFLLLRRRIRIRRNRHSRLFLLVPVFLMFFSAAGLPAVSSSGDTPFELIAKATLFGDTSCAVYTVSMDISERTGTKSRIFELYRQEAETEQKFLAQIIQPVFLRNMKLLSITSGDSEARWLKTSRGVKRLSPGMSNDQPLFDSDFSTSDLMVINPDNYTLTLLEETAETAVILAESADRKDRRKITIDKASYLVNLVDYLNADNRIYKQYTLEETTEVDGKSFPLTAVMQHPLEDTKTTLTIQSIDFPASIPARYFISSQL